MEYQELFKAAVQAIGADQTDDYVIAPSAHSQALAATAPALSAVLGSSRVATLARQYERKNSEALEAQTAFVKSATRANWAVFITVCLSALLMVVGLLVPPASGKLLLVLLGCCSVVVAALGTMWLFKARQGGLLDAWLTARASAENMRLAYFSAVTSADGAGQPSEIPLPLLQVEYFRRYQLDVQRAYFLVRGKQHKAAADKILNLSAIAVALGALATGLAGLLGSLDPRFAALASVGVVAAGLSAFATAKEALALDRRNAEQYAKTLDALEMLAGKLDDVREAAAKGSAEPLRQFVAAVHEQLELDTRQWLGAAENTKASLAKLEDALNSARTKAGKASGAGK